MRNSFETAHSLRHRPDAAIALAILVISTIWAPLLALILPTVLIATGIRLLVSDRWRRVGGYLMWAGVLLAAITALAAYGLDGGTHGDATPIHLTGDTLQLR